jgi:SseB protein C-terminal domain/SseB protein N-terminal domain
MNKLDQAIVAVNRSRSHTPELFRQLTEGELWFLIPYHPEIAGEWMAVKEGEAPPFCMIADEEGGEVVPLFSSEERVEEGLEKHDVPEHTYMAAAMPAVLLLELLGKGNLRAVVNKGCATGQVTIPANLMRGLADGSALRPRPGLGTKEGRLKHVDPVDYPTNLLQAVFEFIRRHPNFRAAWVFDSSLVVEKPVEGRCWQLIFVMSPRDEVLSHDLDLIIQSVRSPEDHVEMGLLDEEDTAAIEKLFSETEPFYAAPGYGPGAAAGDDVAPGP